MLYWSKNNKIWQFYKYKCVFKYLINGPLNRVTFAAPGEELTFSNLGVFSFPPFVLRGFWVKCTSHCWWCPGDLPPLQMPGTLDGPSWTGPMHPECSSAVPRTRDHLPVPIPCSSLRCEATESTDLWPEFAFWDAWLRCRSLVSGFSGACVHFAVLPTVDFLACCYV